MVTGNNQLGHILPGRDIIRPYWFHWWRDDRLHRLDPLNPQLNPAKPKRNVRLIPRLRLDPGQFPLPRRQSLSPHYHRLSHVMVIEHLLSDVIDNFLVLDYYHQCDDIVSLCD